LILDEQRFPVEPLLVFGSQPISKATQLDQHTHSSSVFLEFEKRLGREARGDIAVDTSPFRVGAEAGSSQDCGIYDGG
jgi:hypothetical protein